MTKGGDRKKLMLDGDRARDFEGWSRQVGEFYAQALGDADLLQLLTTEFNLTREKLEAGQALYQAAIAASQQQAAQIGAKQNATQARDAVMDEVDVWMGKYQAAAEVALADTPQLLESLGWFVRNEPASATTGGNPSPDPGAA